MAAPARQGRTTAPIVRPSVRTRAARTVGLLATGTARTACVVVSSAGSRPPRRRDAVGDGVVQLQLSLVYVLAIHLQGRLLLGRVRGAQE